MPISSISIIFPAYNEEKNIGASIDSAIIYCKQNIQDFEIIVVNDGSKDSTKDVVLAKSKDNPRVKLIDNEKNLGYGQTVWKGLTSASKDWVFFTDGDLQFDIKEIDKLIKFCDNYNVVIGYRNPRKDQLIRKIFGKGWTILSGIMLGVWVKDVDCAFKLFKKSSLEKIEVESGGATFSPELLWRLKKNNEKFKQIPETHFARREGKQTGANFRVIKRALKELWLLRKH